MSTTLTFGIFSYTDGDYLDEVDVDFNTEVAERRGTSGDIKKVKDFNPTNDLTVKGGGQPAISVGVATLAVTGLTGGVKMCSKFGHTEKSNDFDDFNLTAKHYPGGSAG